MPRFQPFEQPADDLDMSTCRCGSALPDTAEWCPICFRKVVDQDELLAELHDTFHKTTWSPPSRLVAPAPPKRFTRWRATLFTFGPRVKVPITVVISVWMLYSFWITQPWRLMKRTGVGDFGKPFLVFQLAISLIVGSLLLRVLWQKAREQ